MCNQNRFNAQAANNDSSYLDKRTVDKNEQRQVSNVRKKPQYEFNKVALYLRLNTERFF